MDNQSNQRPGLANKTVVILGGSAGLGLATAKAAAAEGAKIIIVSSNQVRIDKALQELPTGSSGHSVDLSQEEKIKEFFEKTGPFDHLVYTAGENLNLGKIAEADLQKASQFFTIRYWGAIAAVKYGAPNIKAGGSITLTSGIASLRPQSGWGLGASICGAMDAFARAMAVELGPVRVNIVSPGIVKTDLWNNIEASARNAMFTVTGNTLPVGSVGEADDVAQTYLYLMKQPFSTGQTIVVDGGAVLV